MHKLKKAAAELRDYLGRDTEGLELLKQLEDVGNDLRKQVAAEKTEAEKATQLKHEAIAEARAAREESSRLRTELQQAQAVRQQLERDVAAQRQLADALQQQLDALLGKCDPVANVSTWIPPEAFARSVKALRRWRMICPESTGRMVFDDDVESGAGFVAGRECLIFELGDFVTGLTNDQLVLLGRMVAVLALVGQPCVFESRFHIVDFYGGKRPSDELSDEHELPELSRWFRRNYPAEDLVDCEVVGDMPEKLKPVVEATGAREQLRKDLIAKLEYVRDTFLRASSQPARPLLPGPTAEPPLTDIEHWTEKNVRGMTQNPVYCGIGPYPAVVPAAAWIHANLQVLADEGPEQYLVNLVHVLKTVFGTRELDDGYPDFDE